MSTLTPDRRWLWRVHGLLSVTATSDAQHATRDELLGYLRDTCTHYWDHVPAADYAPDHETAPDLLQCRHCSAIRVRGDEPQTEDDQAESTRERVRAARAAHPDATVSEVGKLVGVSRQTASFYLNHDR